MVTKESGSAAAPDPELQSKPDSQTMGTPMGSTRINVMPAGAAGRLREKPAPPASGFKLIVSETGFAVGPWTIAMSPADERPKTLLAGTR